MIKPLLDSGELQPMLDWLQTRSEKQRREAAPEVLAWLADPTPGVPREAVQVAVVGCLVRSELKKLWPWTFPDPDLTAQLWRQRGVDWLDEWVVDCFKSPRSTGYWPWIRALVRHGCIARPDHPDYILGMILGPTSWLGTRATPLEMLERDPELVNELWLLFEHEGGGEVSLTNYDRFSSGSWNEAVRKLLPRQRLLRETVVALGRDFNHYRARWFSDLHSSLGPSDEEMLELAPAYLPLTRSSSPATVALAHEVIERLVHLEPCPWTPQQILPCASDLLSSKTAGVVKKGLNLLESLVGRRPELRREAAERALDGLVHDKAEVQKAVLSCLHRWNVSDFPDLLERLREQAEFLAPSQRAELARQFGAVTVPGPAEPDPRGQEAEDQGGLRLRPPHTLDELLLVCARALENLQADDWELAIDGVSRLCGEDVEDFPRRISSLKNRVTTLRRKPVEPGPRELLLELLECWWSHTLPPAPRKTSDKLLHWLRRRMRPIFQRVAGRRGQPLLSRPEFADGKITPELLQERQREFASRGWECDPLDLLLARERAGLVERERLSLRWWVESKEYEVHGKQYIYRTFHVESDPAGGAGPDSEEGAALHREWLERREVQRAWRDPVAPELGRLVLTLWPHHQDLGFVFASRFLANVLDETAAGIGDRWMLEPLVGASMTEAARLLLALALGCKEPGLQGLGVEALARACREQKLEIQAQAVLMAELMSTGLITVRRWAGALQQAARHPGALPGVTQLVRGLAQAPLNGVRDGHLLVELAVELSLEAGSGPQQVAPDNVAAAQGKTRLASALRQLAEI